METLKDRKGFSMVELLVAIAVLMVIGGVTLLNLYPARNAASIKGTTQQMVALLRQAQSLSVTQSQGSSWGVHFSNNASGSFASVYALFKGTAYAASSALGTYRLPSGVCYGNIARGSSTDIAFSQILGQPLTQSSTFLSLLTCQGSGSRSVSSLIHVFPSGLVSTVGYYVYGSDVGNQVIKRFDQDGNYLSQFGGGYFSYQNYMANDAGNGVYVGNGGNPAILKFDVYGNYITQFGICGGGTGQLQCGAGPVPAVSPNNMVYVADKYNGRVELWTAAGQYVKQFPCATGACPASPANGSFDGLSGVAIDLNGNLWVADKNNNRVQELDPEGNYVQQLGGCPSGACPASSATGSFNAPIGVAVDSFGDVYVSEYSPGNNRVQKFDPGGRFLLQIGCPLGTAPCPPGNGPGQFNGPVGIAVDPVGDVFVADGSYRIEKFDPNGNFVTQWGGFWGIYSVAVGIY